MTTPALVVHAAAPAPSMLTPRPLELVCQMEFEAAAAPADGAAPRLPRFSMLAYTGAPMQVAGWRHPVVVDLAGLAIPSQNRPIRFGHDASSGIGHTDAIQVEAGQLHATGVVSRDTPEAREIVTSSKNGFPWQASIGASVDQFEFIKEGQMVMVNGRQIAGPVNVVRKATLGEISFVDLGADGATQARVAATAHTQETQVMDDGVNSNHSDGGTGVTTPLTAPAAPAPATPVTPQPTAEQVRAQALAETNRIVSIRAACDGKHDAIEAQAIREGWDLPRTQLAVLRREREQRTGTFTIHTPETPTVDAAVLEAACMLTAQLPNAEKLYPEQALDTASKRYRGGIGLQELLLEAAWANGYTGGTFRDSRNVLRFAFAQSVQGAGFSTIDIGGILSNVTNKFLLDGFYSVERTWRNVCAVRNVSDFKTVTSYRLIGTDQYEKVAPGGELKHGTLGQEMYSNKADTYGLLLGVDRRDIINDDLGAITLVPRKLGRGSGVKINDVFWTIFLGNDGFFTAAAKNYLEGDDTALSIDGLTKAEVAFLEQVDADGKPIGVMPVIVLVPTHLSAIGTQLFKSLELRTTVADQTYPVSNPHQGKFRVEVSRYLANARYAGNSAKGWYLLADPNDLPVIEVAFLNGNESPTIETAEADFNQLGVQMRGYHDFGVALQDPRGGVKSKGEA